MSLGVAFVLIVKTSMADVLSLLPRQGQMLTVHTQGHDFQEARAYGNRGAGWRLGAIRSP